MISSHHQSHVIAVTEDSDADYYRCELHGYKLGWSGDKGETGLEALMINQTHIITDLIQDQRDFEVTNRSGFRNPKLTLHFVIQKNQCSMNQARIQYSRITHVKILKR